MAINIEYVKINSLIVPEWKATYTLRPELMVISASLTQFGFIQPIHVRKETNEIIDGSERMLLAKNVEEIYKNEKGMIPVVFHNVDQLRAAMMHLQLNRGKSTIVAARASKIIRTAQLSGEYNEEDFRDLLAMRNEELSLMLDGTVLKARNIKEHNYARAWVPIEAPASASKSEPFVVESPPNPDR